MKTSLGSDADLVALIKAFHLAADAPLESFLNSWKPGDLDDFAAALGITPEQAERARTTMNGEKTS